MIPGTTSKLTETTVPSGTTISAKSDIVKLTGTTAIQTIIPNFGAGFSGLLFLVTTGGAVTLGTSGNILTGYSIPNNASVVLVYVKSLGKWIINAGI